MQKQIWMPLLRKAAVKELDGDACFIFLIFLNKESVRRSVCVLGRLQRWYVTIPSSDQWWATIKKHRNRWLPDPKTIEPNGCPKPFHSIVMVPLKTIEKKPVIKCICQKMGYVAIASQRAKTIVDHHTTIWGKPLENHQCQWSITDGIIRW